MTEAKDSNRTMHAINNTLAKDVERYVDRYNADRDSDAPRMTKRRFVEDAVRDALNKATQQQ